MIITGFRDYRKQVIEALKRGYEGSLGNVANVILHAHKQGNAIFTCGNGGGAATAMHFAADLRSIGIQSYDLLSPCKLTQIGNDDGFANIFSDQIKDRLLIAFSCSGTSPNITGTSYYNDMILFTGNIPSDRMLNKVLGVPKITIRARSDDYEVIEDIHLMMCHALKKMLKERLAK